MSDGTNSSTRVNLSAKHVKPVSTRRQVLLPMAAVLGTLAASSGIRAQITPMKEAPATAANKDRTSSPGD